MSHTLQEKTAATVGRSRSPEPGKSRRRLVAMIVGLALVLGGAAGWTVSNSLSSGSQDRSLEAQQARLQGAAEHHEQLQDARRQEVERLRWEAQADRYAPGWRDR
jgi:hypothetical protein